ncbi:PWI domain-containing protein [Syncephalis plumigaleata]|nr:PWI domain-containing protein [Syncephalis plumigaleata]
MGDGGFFKGTSADQDSRFSNKHRKLLKSMTFPASFKKKVNMSKVNMNVMRLWIARRVKELLGIEDEVVVEFVYGMLEEKELDPRRIQIDLTGFLEDKAPQFVVELWELLLSAQENVAVVIEIETEIEIIETIIIIIDVVVVVEVDGRQRLYRSGYDRNRHQSSRDRSRSRDRDREHYRRRERSREDTRHRSHTKSAAAAADVESDQSEDMERSRRQRRHQRESTNTDTTRDTATMEE